MLENFVGRAFGELQNAVGGFVDGGHHFAHGVKRRFRHAGRGFKHVVLVKPQLQRIGNQRRLRRFTDQIAVVVNVDVGAKRHAFGEQFFVVAVMLDNGHFVLGERAGFVRADNLRAAERFHGGKSSDNRVLFRHIGHADLKARRSRPRQALRESRQPPATPRA